MEMPFHQQQLDWMAEFAKHRIDALNPFFLFLNYFDTEYFFFLLIPLIWIGFSYRWGIKIFYLFTINGLLNGLLKQTFGWPRPSQDLPEIGLLHFKSFGFPSGAAQTSILLGGLLIYYWKNKKAAWTVAVPYILLISFSRIYLEVHYPTDIWGGWIFGLMLLFVFIQTIGPIEKFFKSKSLAFGFLISLILPILFLLPFSKSYMLGSCLGASLGIYFSLKNDLYLPDENRFSKAFLRGFLAILFLTVIFFLWPQTFPGYTRAFALSLSLTFVASPVCRYILKIK